MNANAHKSHFEFVGSRIVNVEINHTYIAMDINNSSQENLNFIMKLVKFSRTGKNSSEISAS